LLWLWRLPSSRTWCLQSNIILSKLRCKWSHQLQCKNPEDTNNNFQKVCEFYQIMSRPRREELIFLIRSYFFNCLNSYTCYSIYEVNFPKPIRYPDMTKRSTLIKQGTHDPPTLNAHNVVAHLRPLVLEFSHAQIMFTPLDFVEEKVLLVKFFSGCLPVDFNITNIFFIST
jgi:hypothetical protein